MAPVALMSKDPVVSDEIIAPPKSMVSAATNNVCHLRVLEPRVNTPS